MTSMWTQTLAQASRIEERAHFLFTPHVESDIKHVVKKNLAHQSRDVSGWDFEKKVSVLAELQEMIEAPSFKYVDWGESVPAKVKGIALLPLALGQEALLDLWTYIMEFCDVVPVRTGARGLFLRLAGCICRRLEFVNGVEMNGMPLKMDPTSTLSLSLLDELDLTTSFQLKHGTVSLRAATRDDEAAFIRRCPHLYMATPQLTSDVVMAALAPFLDRLKTPSRDSILFVVFLGTFVEDSTSMLFYRQPPAATPPFWHCVPGYFVCIQAFVNVFKKVCLRRKKDRDAQIVTKDADVVVNPWFPYWTNNELEPVYDGLGDILANGALLNVFVQVILESTNMYDPHSVDYAFNVLQNAFETAAAATGSRHKHGDSHHVQGDSAGGARSHLPIEFDLDPFFRPQHEPAPHVLQGLASYFAPAPTKKMSPQAVTDDHNHALERLIVWDTTATPRQSNQKQKQERLFRDSLSNDDLMLDLSVTSKLDAVLKMIAEQIHAHDDGTSPSGMYFPRRLQVYAQKALSQYVGLLWMYYKAAFDDLSVPPTAPTLEFNVQTFFGSSD
ncbi:hypothetical protein DYB32_008756 [Aphanomyces invadans]|uniref:Uncharacterized protein n=1 Tax=Aphanomyces invadans TaxID=157072 RepID=A0A3R6YTF7_9STRA|nr:hypothetical protein DYB32_008756 [Aphanomyces invadans]